MNATTERRIRSDLKRLQRMRPAYFGSYETEFVLNPPLAQRAAIDFEQRHGIQLPPDYRWFVTVIANGGAGPGYGVFRLGEMDHDQDMAVWKEGDGFVGVMANVFPFTDSWNDLSGMPTEELLEEDEDAYEEQLSAFEKRYFAPVDGAIPICHLGCAIRVWLIVSGAEAGHVWLDDRASDAGWQPLSRDNSARLTFLQWYEDWIDRGLQGEDA